MRSTTSQVKKRVPLQEAPNRINEGRKRTVKKSEPKRKNQQVATKTSRKDEYSLENLRAIFEEEEKAEEKLVFKATSTPYDSQLSNSQAIQEEQISNQRQLDVEINKIHESINKESIMLLIEELSPQPNSKIKSTLNHTRGKRQKKQAKPNKFGQNTDTEKKQKPYKSNTRKPHEHPVINDNKPKKRSKKAETVKEPKKDLALVDNQKSRPVSKRITRLESKSKGSLHQAQKAPTKSNPKMNPKVTTKGARPSKISFKNEFTYKQLLLKCAKGKDPIDLLV